MLQLLQITQNKRRRKLHKLMSLIPIRPECVYAWSVLNSTKACVLCALMLQVDTIDSFGEFSGSDKITRIPQYRHRQVVFVAYIN